MEESDTLLAAGFEPNPACRQISGLCGVKLLQSIIPQVQSVQPISV